MFSVEDLLISHGYKLSKTPDSLYGNRCDGYQQEVAERRPAHGTLNGLPPNSGTYACVKKTATKSHLNDNESSYISQPGPGYQKDFRSLANTHASDGRFYDQPQLVSSLHPKRDKDLAYWRRRGQDFSALFGCTDRGDSEMKGIAAPRALYGHDKDGQWDVGGGTERMRRTGLQEKWKPPGDYRWHSLRTEGWNLRVSSDGDRERLLQDQYSVKHGGEATIASHHKGKSQSLPRVLSPESLRCVEMPSLVNHHSLSGTKISRPQARLTQETSKHSEPTAPFLPLPKPKYGRPLKPPSYELHQQTRGMLETNLFQDGQQKEEATSYSTKGNEPSPDGSTQDSSLEPPVYIPPPCYKSPAQQNTNQNLPSEVPEYDMCFNNGLQHPVERATLSYQSSVSNFGTREQHCKDEQIPYDRKRHRKHVASHLSSVQYIPFDDPRIRHIKIAHADSLPEGKVTGDANRISPCAFQKSALEPEYNSAFLDTSDSLTSTAVKYDQDSGGSVNSSRWLAESNVDQDSCALPIQRDCYDAGNDTSHKNSKSGLFAQSPHTEPPLETVTKVKAFEPGTEVQSKRSSKKKMNETIFCLVSIPVKSELNLSDTDRNNNLMQGAVEKNGFDNSGALLEQSLLSTSSTDLELQALTGNMTNKNELQKQESWKLEFKQMNDFRLSQPTKHKELQYSGSWPGDHYKDEQTQTSFTEEPKHLQLSHGFKPTGLTKGPATQLLRNAEPVMLTATEPVMLTALPANDRKCWQDAYRVKSEGYLDTSSSRVCSKTAVVAPKACQKNPTYASSSSFPGWERETSSLLREEAGATSSSKELFGQFLLKPVGRRPWDVISELESFNKELQEQEESSEDGVENEDKRKRGEKDGSQESGACRTEEMSQDCRPAMQSETDMVDAPVFQQIREKSKAEHLSWFEGLRARVNISGRSHSCLEAEEIDESVRARDGYANVPAEPRKQEAGKRITKQALSLCPVKKVQLDSYSDENHDNPFDGISFRETAQVKNHSDEVAHFDRIKNNTVPWNSLLFERGSGVRLSLTNRNHGLSEPDLRSIGLEGGSHAPGTVEHDFGKPGVAEIPPNESLQERAARILGIEVAVETLVPNGGALQDEHFHPGGIPESLELSAEGALGSKREVEATSYEGRRKCGWTESSLFVGDRNVLLGSIEDQDSDHEAVLHKHHCEPHRGLGRQGEDQPPTPESVVLPFSERNSVLSGVEKRARSTSKVIETLQGKLASPPSRAAMDRLVRMKEVDSVSRMRRLSIKNADSVEDGDEDKQTRRVEERGNSASFGSNELARKMSHGSSVSKRIISLAENGLSDSVTDRKTGRDLFCLDAYDPTRVEKV